jgi:hypothetical protein
LQFISETLALEFSRQLFLFQFLELLMCFKSFYSIFDLIGQLCFLEVQTALSFQKLLEDSKPSFGNNTQNFLEKNSRFDLTLAVMSCRCPEITESSEKYSKFDNLNFI